MAQLRVKKRVRVLVVDDQKSSCELAMGLLKSQGCEVICAHSAKEAVHQMAADHFDLVVLDWLMPGMDGALALQVLEQLPRRFCHQYSERIPFVLYSGCSAHTINLPHVTRFQLLDFWNKQNKFGHLQKRVFNVVRQLRRRGT